MSWGAEDLSAALGAASKYDAGGELELHLQAGPLAVPRGRGRRGRPAGRRRIRRLQGRDRPQAPKPRPRAAKASPASSRSTGAGRRSSTPLSRRRRRKFDTPRRSSPRSRHIPTRACCPSGAKWSIARTSCRLGAYWNDHDRRLSMATTAEPHPTSTQEATNQTDHRQGLGHRRSRPAASADGVRAARASARRCRDQDHLRRHLPQRPSHLPQRLGRHRLSGNPRPRDRRHGHRDRQRGHPAPRRRHGRRRLHGRQLHGMRPVPRRLGSVLPQGLRPDLQQRRLSRRHDHARAATPTISSCATISS